MRIQKFKRSASVLDWLPSLSSTKATLSKATLASYAASGAVASLAYLEAEVAALSGADSSESPLAFLSHGLNCLSCSLQFASGVVSVVSSAKSFWDGETVIAAKQALPLVPTLLKQTASSLGIPLSPQVSQVLEEAVIASVFGDIGFVLTADSKERPDVQRSMAPIYKSLVAYTALKASSRLLGFEVPLLSSTYHPKKAAASATDAHPHVARRQAAPLPENCSVQASQNYSAIRGTASAFQANMSHANSTLHANLTLVSNAQATTSAEVTAYLDTVTTAVGNFTETVRNISDNANQEEVGQLLQNITDANAASTAAMEALKNTTIQRITTYESEFNANSSALLAEATRLAETNPAFVSIRDQLAADIGNTTQKIAETKGTVNGAFDTAKASVNGLYDGLGQSVTSTVGPSALVYGNLVLDPQESVTSLLDAITSAESAESAFEVALAQVERDAARLSAAHGNIDRVANQFLDAAERKFEEYCTAKQLNEDQVTLLRDKLEGFDGDSSLDAIAEQGEIALLVIGVYLALTKHAFNFIVSGRSSHIKKKLGITKLERGSKLKDVRSNLGKKLNEFGTREGKRTVIGFLEDTCSLLLWKPIRTFTNVDILLDGTRKKRDDLSQKDSLQVLITKARELFANRGLPPVPQPRGGEVNA